MTLFAQISSGAYSPELTVGWIAIAGFFCVGLWRVIRWMRRPLTPDPWGPDVADELLSEEAVPLCHHCLAPQPPEADFCLECGAAVGPYTNYLPFPYIFGLGQGLRLGTSGQVRHAPFIVVGYLIVSLAEYMIFAPVYWFMFFRNYRRHEISPGG